MALWKIKKIQKQSGPVVQGSGWVTTVVDTETGDEKIIVHTLDDPNPYDGWTAYACNLQMDYLITPNDFGTPICT